MDAMTEPRVQAPPGVAARAVDAVKVYGVGQAEVRALDGVNVEFPREQFSAIMGPSGSGKSTLLHCLAGLDSLSGGKIFLGEADLGALSEKELTLLRRERVGFIFQFFNLVPTLTAGDNVTLPIALAGRKPEEEWLDSVVGTLGIADRLTHLPAELSGGQQQRVAVARALVNRPEIVFADEPTGNLDSRSGAEVLRFMRQAVDEFGQTIVMVTHDANAASRADRVVFLSDGRIVDEMAHPTADRILEHMKGLGE
jgi:putative ABC transport system ATP-binding protein